jgi:hypothetical protein
MQIKNNYPLDSYDHFERTRRQALFWLMWVIANSLGLALGWAVGETLGQLVGKTINWPLGITVAWAIFEAATWLMRGIVLFRTRELSAWRPIDTTIWLIAESAGWLFGEGLNEVVGPVWATSGAIWGTLMGAGLLITIWFIKQPKPRTRWWPLAASIWTFFGLAVGSLFISVAMTTTLVSSKFKLSKPNYQPAKCRAQSANANTTRSFPIMMAEA